MPHEGKSDETGRSTNRTRRSWVVALLIVVVMIAVWILRRGDEEPPPGPTGERPRFPAVIRIRIEARDGLVALMPIFERLVSPADEIAISEDGRRVEMGPGFLDAIRSGEGGGLLAVGPGVRGPDDIGCILILERVYTGEGRWGTFRSASVTRDLPPPPVHALPAPLEILEFDPPDEIFDKMPWPEKLAWRLSSEGDLVVRFDGGERIVDAGGEATLPVAERKVTVRFGDVPADPEAEGTDAAGILWDEEKEVSFSTMITIHYAGRLPLVVLAPPASGIPEPGPRED